MQVLLKRQADGLQNGVVAGNTQQAQADHQHAGDGAAAKGNVHGLADPVPGCFCGAHVGAYRHVHADVAGQPRQHRTDRKADRGVPTQKQPDQHEQHHACDGNGQVLPVEVGACALLDGSGDFLHACIAARLRDHPARRQHAIDNGQDRTTQREHQSVVFQHDPSQKNGCRPVGTNEGRCATSGTAKTDSTA